MLYVRFLFWLIAYIAIAPIFFIGELLVCVLERPINFIDRTRSGLLVDLDYGEKKTGIDLLIAKLVWGAPWP